MQHKGVEPEDKNEATQDVIDNALTCRHPGFKNLKALRQIRLTAILMRDLFCVDKQYRQHVAATQQNKHGRIVLEMSVRVRKGYRSTFFCPDKEMTHGKKSNSMVLAMVLQVLLLTCLALLGLRIDKGRERGGTRSC